MLRYDITTNDRVIFAPERERRVLGGAALGAVRHRSGLSGVDPLAGGRPRRAAPPPEVAAPVEPLVMRRGDLRDLLEAADVEQDAQSVVGVQPHRLPLLVAGRAGLVAHR